LSNKFEEELRMDLESALATLGVTPLVLSGEQSAELDENGYLPLPGALDDSALAAVAARVNELVEVEGSEAGTEFRREEGTDRLSNLVDKGDVFDQCWNYPPQLAAVAHVFAGDDFKLHSLNTRSALPGCGRQALHTDWAEAVPPDRYQVCNSVWMLDDFTAENGPTRVVPGSHRWGKIPKDVLADPMADYPEQLSLLGEAGTCVVFNSHVWHSGTTNHSSKPRRALHAAFVRRDQAQQTVQKDFLRPETLGRLTPAQRFLLDA
jgi:ectoine hydroxylase-related dioxygenase (phytanoyl-CoA dioxygenase family)